MENGHKRKVANAYGVPYRMKLVKRNPKVKTAAKEEVDIRHGRPELVVGTDGKLMKRTPKKLVRPFITAEPESESMRDKTLSAKTYQQLSELPSMKRLRKWRGAMTKALDKKGIKMQGKPLAQLANSFYTNIVARSQDSYVSNKEMNLDNMYWDNLDETAIDSLVQGIFGYVKNVSKKKEDMGPEGLTKFEQFIANQFENVEEKSEELAKKEASLELGQSLLFGKLGLIVLVVIVFLLFRNKK